MRSQAGALPRPDDRRTRLRAAATARAGVSSPHLLGARIGKGPDGDVRLQLEPLQGPTLARVMRRGPLGPKTAVTILVGLARAVDALEGRRLVARDLAPDHVLLDRKRGAVLAEYGLPPELVPLGRPDPDPKAFYRAPEEARGRLTPRSSVYSLGAILLASLTGEAQPERLDARARGRRRREIPAPLAAVIERAMAPDPRQRYANVAELAQAAIATIRSDEQRIRPVAELKQPRAKTPKQPRAKTPTQPGAKTSKQPGAKTPTQPRAKTPTASRASKPAAKPARNGNATPRNGRATARNGNANGGPAAQPASAKTRRLLSRLHTTPAETTPAAPETSPAPSDQTAAKRAERERRAKEATERKAAEQAERDRRAREATERKAAERAEAAKKRAAERAERDRRAQEAAERKKAEAAAKAAEKLAERERRAKAAAERKAAEQAERERRAAEEAERKKAEAAESAAGDANKRAERERRAKEAADRKAAEKAERERRANEAAARKAAGRAETEKKSAADRAERERLARQAAERKKAEAAAKAAEKLAERERRAKAAAQRKQAEAERKRERAAERKRERAAERKRERGAGHKRALPRRARSERAPHSPAAKPKTQKSAPTSEQTTRRRRAVAVTVVGLLAAAAGAIALAPGGDTGARRASQISNGDLSMRLPAGWEQIHPSTARFGSLSSVLAAKPSKGDGTVLLTGMVGEPRETTEALRRLAPNGTKPVPAHLGRLDVTRYDNLKSGAGSKARAYMLNTTGPSVLIVCEADAGASSAPLRACSRVASTLHLEHELPLSHASAKARRPAADKAIAELADERLAARKRIANASIAEDQAHAARDLQVIYYEASRRVEATGLPGAGAERLVAALAAAGDSYGSLAAAIRDGDQVAYDDARADVIAREATVWKELPSAESSPADQP
jgi:hypothetical protein